MSTFFLTVILSHQAAKDRLVCREIASLAMTRKGFFIAHDRQLPLRFAVSVLNRL